MLRSTIFLACLACFSLAVDAAAPLAGPVEAVTFDAPTHSFRNVTGTLGSAMLDSAVLAQVDFGAVAPHLDYGIAVQGGQLSMVSGFASGQLSTAVVPGTFSTPDGAVWSGDGSTAVMYSLKDGWLQRISGLPASPVVESAVSASGLSAVAATMNGQRVFAALAGSGVYELNSQSLSPVLPLANAVALAVADARGTLYVLETSSGQVYEWSLADSTSTSWSIAEVYTPVSLLAAADASQRWQIYVAGGGATSMLATYDADAHTLSSAAALEFHPTVMRILGSASFVVRDRQVEGEPLWSFSATETATAACPTGLRTCRVNRRARRGGDGGGEGDDLPAPSAKAATTVYFIPATPLTAGGVQ